jgi:hypothetical protein
MVYVSNHFEPVTSFQQPKEVTKKGRSRLKFLTAKNDLLLGRYECIPSSFTQITSQRGVRCHLPQE